MIVKVPLQIELFREMRSHCLHPERFGGVVAGIDDVQAPFHGIEVGVVRPFPGYVRIHPGIPRLGDHVPATSGYNPDSGRLFGTSRYQ